MVNILFTRVLTILLTDVLTIMVTIILTNAANTLPKKTARRQASKGAA